MYFLWYLLIGLVAGWLANLLVKGHGSGLVVNLIVGIVGGMLPGITTVTAVALFVPWSPSGRWAA